jgi:DNA-binding NarL/FixJ family response regulator
MANKKTTLIVDDHPLFREGVKTSIEHTPHFTVVGEAGNGKEALAMAKALRPDLVLLDLSLPDQSGVEVTWQTWAFLPNTRVIIVSMHSKVELISKAFQAGATGYVVKEWPTEKLVESLEAVSKGEHFLDSALSQKVVSKLVESSGQGLKERRCEVRVPDPQGTTGPAFAGRGTFRQGNRREALYQPQNC